MYACLRVCECEHSTVGVEIKVAAEVPAITLYLTQGICTASPLLTELSHQTLLWFLRQGLSLVWSSSSRQDRPASPGDVPVIQKDK